VGCFGCLIRVLGFPFGVFGGLGAWVLLGFFFWFFFFCELALAASVYTPGVLRGALRFLINLLTYKKKNPITEPPKGQNNKARKVNGLATGQAGRAYAHLLK